MNNLVLSYDRYHMIVNNNKKINEQFTRTLSPYRPLNNTTMAMLDYFAVVCEDHVEFHKNRFTGDKMMSLEEFETFRKEFG